MRISVVFISLFFSVIVFGQVKVTTTNTNGEISFYSDNSSYSNYYLIVTLKNVKNYNAFDGEFYKNTVRHGRQRLFTLRKSDDSKTTSYGYSYKYYEGCKPPPKIDEEVIYQMPIRVGGKSEVILLTNFQAKHLKDRTPTNWYSMAFKMEEGDTVFASRKGVVTETKDSFYSEVALSFSTEDNFVKVMHEDCSMGLYRVLEKNKVFVKPGDKVLPGDPIGLAGGHNYTIGTQARFSVYYRNVSLKWTYVVPTFRTSKGDIVLLNRSNYQAVHSEELRRQELSKRELKKYLKSKNN